MARASTVRVKGLKETQRAFRNAADKSEGRMFREKVKDATEPVRADAVRRLGRFKGVSTNVRPRLRGGSVFVTQQAKKVTGLRPDFGQLQMQEAFIPALDDNQEQVIRGIEKALDDLADDAGLK